MGEAKSKLVAAVRAKDAAYAERNYVVALLAKLAAVLGWRAGTAQHPEADETWDRDWRTIVYIELPTGQVSWHLHDSERHLVDWLSSTHPVENGSDEPIAAVGEDADAVGLWLRWARSPPHPLHHYPPRSSASGADRLLHRAEPWATEPRVLRMRHVQRRTYLLKGKHA